MSDWTKDKDQGPWEFEKQRNKYGYNNNPRWQDAPVAPFTPTSEKVIWTPAGRTYNSGEAKSHHKCGHWHLPVEVPPVPESIILWYSCPSSFAYVNGEIWFATTLAYNYDEYEKATDTEYLNDTFLSPDALYIIKYNFTTKLWSTIYLLVGTEDYRTLWLEPQISLKTLNGMTVLALASSYDYHLEVRVFNGETLTNTLDPDYVSSLSPFYSGYRLRSQTLLIESNGYIHLTGRNLTTGNTFQHIYSTDNGATWASNAIGSDVLILSSSDPYNGYILEWNSNLWCFCWSYHRATPVGSYALYKSTDHGLSWSLISTPSITYGTVHDFMANDNDLYILAPDSAPLPSSAGYLANWQCGVAVFKSTNNGLSFTKHTVLTSDGSTMFAGGSMTSDGTYLYLIATIYDSGGAPGAHLKSSVYRSTDGETWSFLTFLNTSLSLRDMQAFFCVDGRLFLSGYYPDWLTGELGLGGTPLKTLCFLYSDDQGENWTAVQTPFYDLTGGGGKPIRS